MGVPGTEKTQFDHRRTEALNCLADRALSSVAEESICEYLIERIASSDHDTERRQAATTLAVATTHRSNVASVLSSDSIIQLLDDESDWDVCTRLLASLDGYDTEVSSEVLSIMESKDESLNRLWRTLSDTAFATRLLCPNCGISYSIESVFEGALCDRCGDGYLSAKGAALDF